jgi:hypothetical protein
MDIKLAERIPFFGSRTVIKEMRTELSTMQHAIDILLATTAITSTYGNPYQDYKTAITELAKKYEGIAQWGSPQVQNIIDMRSAFTIGQGIKPISDDEKSREREFINSFIKHNNLDEELPQDLASEAEVEGRILVKLIKNIDGKNIDIRFISYSQTGYKVETDAEDYQNVKQITYKLNGVDKTILPDECVFKRFSGRANSVNDLMPKVAKVLRLCEALDKALWDWREINHLFASPTPFFKCQTSQEATDLNKQLLTSNWKIGKKLVSSADFSLVGLNAEIKTLENEIITLAKIISGATGVPVHFLGLPDLMSNRSTSTDLFEALNASVNKERHIWEGFYEELFDKALIMMNGEGSKKGFEKGKVKAQILNFTSEQIRQLVDVWLPLYQGKVINLKYILSKIPDANYDDIVASMDADSLKMLNAIKNLEKNPTDTGATQ